ncbi:hypothetical protein [Bosea sp. 2RAB26]|uniref:hypothetical protein n=1 Tax=Bosea sp. 2RAB26 TaxID=3237476 RepID=UPI003F91F4D6
MIRAAAVFLALCVASAPAARASTPELETAVYRSIIWGSQLYTIDQRRQLASALTAYWSNFRERIPRLTPREQDWAKGEAEAPDLARVSKFMETREGGLYMAFDQVSRCHGAASTLESAINSPRPGEALAWLAMLRCYRYADDLRIYLNRAGLIAQPRDDLEFKMGATGIIQTAIVGVVESVVISNR